MNFVFENEDNKKKIIETKKISKYPFNGKNVNLIDKILFIGYEQNYIEKYLPEIIDNEINEINLLPKQNIYIRNTFKQKPTVLNEITYDYNFNLIDNSQIIDFLFPDNSIIIIIIANENQKSIKNQLEDYKIIFSKNLPYKQKSKLTINGFANIFFNYIGSKIINNEKYYYFIPFCICILSEYPFFSNFLKISYEIKDKLFLENSGVPIEILLYNTIKFTPSPINNNIKLLFGGFLNEEKKIKNEIITLKILKEQKIPELLFKKLSFYPILDFNLNLIFNLFSTETIIYVFIFTFLEIDIIFFSENIELLNILLFIFSNLNYPLNDGAYFWDIFSVSLDNFNKGKILISKPFPIISGIAKSYNSNNEIEKHENYFVLDIDKKTFFFVNKNKNKYGNDIELLFEGIKAFKTYKIKDSNFNIMKYISFLYNNLEIISKKMFNIYYNEKIFPGFFKIKNSEYENVLEHNKKTQEIFYSFIINILGYFSKDNFSINEKYNQNLKEKSFQLNFKNENEIENQFDNINQIFIQLFKSSQKYVTYIEHYLLNFSSFELYKIPLILTEEIIYMNLQKNRNDLHFNYFELFDYLYDYKEEKEENILKIIYDNIDEMEAEPISEIGKLLNSENILKMKIEKSNYENNKINETINISFEAFLNEYEIMMRKEINREQLDSQNFLGKCLTSKNLIKYKRKNFLLDDELLKKYIYKLNNLKKEKKQLNDIFPKIDIILNQKIDEISYIIISERIEEYLIQKNYYTSYTLIKFSLYNILIIMIDLFNIDPDFINAVTNLFFKTEICDRKYIIMMCLIIFHYYENQIIEEKLNIFCKCFKNLKDYIINKKIFPNKELLDIISLIKDEYKEYDESVIKEIIKLKPNFEENIEIICSQNFLVRYKKDDKQNELFEDNLRKNFEKEIIFVSENKEYIGNLQNYKISFDDENGLNIRWFEILSPKKLFIETKEILKTFLKLINSNYLNKILLLKLISNQILYFKIISLEKWKDSNNELTDIHLNKIIKMLSTFYVLLKNNIDN